MARVYAFAERQSNSLRCAGSRGSARCAGTDGVDSALVMRARGLERNDNDGHVCVVLEFSGGATDHDVVQCAVVGSADHDEIGVRAMREAGEFVGGIAAYDMDFSGDAGTTKSGQDFVFEL